MSPWTDACTLADLPPGGRRTVKQGDHQVVVFHLTDGTRAAIDNRCPHEGFPLSQGGLTEDGDACVLTCQWHNWKFRMSDGACTKGGEDVRWYPVRVSAGTVQIDLSPEDPAVVLARLWSSLAAGLDDHDIGRCARDAIRLHNAGVSTAALHSFVAAWGGDRAQYGASHVLPVACDLLQWEARYPGPRLAIPFAQLCDLASRDAARRPARVPVDDVDPGDDPHAAGAALRDAVDAERADDAEALLRGALARGWRRAELEPWFFALCADHFLSFGHRLIGQIKLFDLLDASGWRDAEVLLRSHLFAILQGTREDLLPHWNAYRRLTSAMDMGALYASAGTQPDWAGADALTSSLISHHPERALGAVRDALTAGAPLDAVITAITLAASERMLRFKVAIDSDPTVQDSWLSVTHTLTFASAVRHAVRRWHDPAVVHLVLQAARFVNHHRVLDDRPYVAPQPVQRATADDVMAATLSGDADTAVSLAAAVANDPAAVTTLSDALFDVALSDKYAAPIVSAHVIKTLLVALEEHTHTGDPRPLMAFVRLAASPIQQRWTQRTAAEAVAFLTDGITPRSIAK